MARNPVQFQKGISLNEFLSLYGTEDQCFDALYRWRWPNGFLCPHCGHDRCCQLSSRKLQQCNRCHRQTSITAGTIFDSTKLPLTVWFQAIYLMTQDKKGVSAMKLHRHLGISYNAAWRMRHKLMQVMMERDREHPLGGWIELDDAYLGGERSGGKRGRGAPGKTPFVAAVETNAQGHPLRMKLTVVEGFRLTEIAAWAQLHLGTGTRVVSDGLACFHGVTAAGCVHEPVVVGSGRAAVERPEFRWVNTILGNIKNALRGTYHAIRPKYAQRYLSEFEYRFNRRFDLPDMRLRDGAYRPLPAVTVLPSPGVAVASDMLGLALRDVREEPMVRLSAPATAQDLLSHRESELAREEEAAARQAAEVYLAQESAARRAAETRNAELEARTRDLENALNSTPRRSM